MESQCRSLALVRIFFLRPLAATPLRCIAITLLIASRLATLALFNVTAFFRFNAIDEGRFNM